MHTAMNHDQSSKNSMQKLCIELIQKNTCSDVLLVSIANKAEQK